MSHTVREKMVGRVVLLTVCMCVTTHGLVLQGQSRAHKETALSMSSWGGLFDAVTRFGSSTKTEALTAKSRVELGGLSISPMGELGPFEYHVLRFI